MKSIVINIGIAYFALMFIAYFFSNGLIFVPPRAGYKNTDDFIKLKTADGAAIYAVYLANKNAKYTLLVSHGNAEDIGYNMPFLRRLRDNGFAVFAYDYHGYGLSSGKPSEKASYMDVDAAYKYLTEDLHVNPNSIIAYGRSLGAAIALDLAVRKPVAGVIMESAFATAFRVMTRFAILPFDKFNSLKKIKNLEVPLLIIHGDHDVVVPFWHGKTLFEAANNPKQFFIAYGANHNDVSLIAGDKYWRTLAEFAAKL